MSANATTEGSTRAVPAYNLSHDQEPEYTVWANSEADVQRGIRLARDRGLGVSVQSTGHGRFMSAEGSVLIVTSAMTGVRVDASARTATIRAGNRWKHVVGESAPLGLAPLHGSSPEVGVGGFTLGGGLGPFSRRYGFGADNVRRLRIVTADGEVREVTADDQDLFWAVRGSKGNLGIMTELEVDLFKVPQFYGGGLYFIADAVEEVLSTYVPWAMQLPDEFGVSLALIKGPQPALIEGDHRFITHIRISHLGSQAEAEALLAPLRALPGLARDTVRMRPYREIGEVHHDGVEPRTFGEKSRYITAPSSVQLREILDGYDNPDGGDLPLLELRRMGGQMARMPDAPNSVAGRAADFTFLLAGRIDPHSVAIRDRLLGVAEPFSTGLSILNFQGDETHPEAVLQAFELEDRARIVDLKRQWDPDNVFRHGHTIPS